RAFGPADGGLRHRSLRLEIRQKRVDTRRDVVADRTNLLERALLRIGELPVHVPLAGNDRARVVAGGDDDVGPPHVLVAQFVWNVVRGVDAELGQRLEHLRLRLRAGCASGRACGMPLPGATTEEPLRNHRAPAVRYTDKEDI